MYVRLNTMQTSAPGGADTLKLDNYPEGFTCAGLLFRVQYPITKTGNATPPTVKDIISAAFQQMTIRHGKTGQRVAYPTVPGAELRNVHRFITREDLPNNIASLTFTGAGNLIVLVDLFIPFAVEELTDGRVRCPGWSQMRTMIVDYSEGAAFSETNAARTNGAAMLIDVDAIGYPSELDRAGSILSYFRADQASLRVEGPDGVLLADWEISHPQASTTIELFSAHVSDREIARTVPPYVAGDDYQLSWDTGISPITDEVTMGFCPNDGQNSGDLPSGAIDYVQASQYVPLLQLRGLFWPPVDPLMASELVREAANVAGGPILGSVPAFNVPGNVARTLPIEMHIPSTPGFTLQPGLLAPDKGTEPYFAAPESLIARLGAQVDVAAVSGPSTTTAQQSSLLDQLTRQVPGLAQQTSGNSQRKAVTDPQKYSRVLESVAGSKGADTIKKLKASLKL